MRILREDPDAFVVAQLESLRPVSPGQPEKARRVRTAFLAQVHELRQQVETAQSAGRHPVISSPVSTGQKWRLTGWAASLQHLFRRETSMLIKPVIVLLVSLSLIFGSAAVTASAAQNSLPGEPLYTVKLLTEDVRLDLASSAQSRLDLALAFSERRVDELADQQQLGQTVNTGLGDRWQQQIDQGLQAAVSMTDAELPGALLQTRQGLLQQEHTLQQLSDLGAVDRVAAQIRQQVQECLHLVEVGLQDPQQFRQQVQNRQQPGLQQHQGTPVQTEKPAPTKQPWFGPGQPSQTQQPGVGGGGQTQVSPASTGPGVQHGTPQPGSGYGYGKASQTPLGSGYGQPQQTPGAGTSAGNSNGECSGKCSGSTSGSGSSNENGTGAGNGASSGGSDNGSSAGGGSGGGSTGGSGGGKGSGGGRP